MATRRALRHSNEDHEASLFIDELNPYFTLYALHPDSSVALSMVVRLGGLLYSLCHTGRTIVRLRGTCRLCETGR